ncbi:hypothetical protein [Phocoenobacter skyensis]|uniref:Uncharacterized protein n=1 Tax=Phocoenobacter skyensis TaxID=97481 RepID=A0A1H7XSB7_9PAST|nr:hypothetical protein [Pasteurella skyensis]MDP8078427.1 hypothetical protein [Pasteurella skyensis]MDP8084481.1 hypothetical protein [Pasteurella skyensis]MDP8184452.1 hypothetical protein [Pasteurella skyensis]QLB23282.1 hypothetical protein A6B44_08720 [Pasteurella skyensis]SEM36832.1 hypothetical protein SAMN05444853_11427 [Pasteurella skyensis]
MNIKKLSVIGILAFLSLNVSYASKSANVCIVSAKFAQIAMAGRQEGASRKEIQKEMDRILKIVKQSGLSKEEIGFLIEMAPVYPLDVSQVKIGKTKKEKRKIVADYMKLREKDCNTALKEMSK